MSALRMACIAAAILAATSGVRAQLPLHPAGLPFDVVGFIQSATLDDPTDVFSGGSVTLNNQTVIVPRNTILQMPATSLTWAEVFKLAPPPYGPTQSGLALSDTPKPLMTYELHVQGNRVGDTFIAGLLFISQQSLNTGQGFINFIDYGTGELHVGGIQGNGATGARVRLNDPIGRFGRASSPDVRFTIDEDNPTVRTETAYPMCVPRFDPAVAADALCPQTNRPIDATTKTFKTIFTMRSGLANPDPDCTKCDATQQAPFEVGDYVTYAGAMFQDGVGRYISASQIIGNVGIFTPPGTQPVYVAIDVILQGVAGAAIAGLPQEAASRTRVEGFTTDPSKPVDIYAMDVDACTGVVTDRFWATQSIDPGPPTGAVLGRFRFRPGAIAKTNVFLPPAREVHVASQGGVVATPVANGLIAGQYHAPNFEFIFPENLGIGNPAVPANFEDFPFLAGGSGPWNGGGPYATALPQGIALQLSPWPGAATPAIAGCVATLPKTQPPDAEAGNDSEVLSGNPIDLDGSLSKDRNSPGLPLTYAWVQIGGPSVALTNSNSPKASFSAPMVPGNAQPVPLSFLLTVTNGTFAATATVTHTVKPGLPPNVVVGADQMVAGGKTVTLDASASTDPNNPPFLSPMTFTWTQTGGTPLPAGALTNANTSKASFVAPSGPDVLTFSVTVDNGAVPKSASTKVTVIAPPVANGGADQTVATSAAVTLDASASSDPNTPAQPLTYTWSQTSGPSVTLSSNNVAKPTFTAPSAAGALVFKVTVDNGFLNSTANVTVNVKLPPSANAGTNQTVATGTAVTLNGTGSSDPNTPALTLKYSWAQASGPMVTLANANTATATFTAPATTAALGFTLTVDNGVATATASVTVSAEIPPTANAGANQTVASGAAVTLDGSASSDTNTPPATLTYAWRQTGGTPIVSLAAGTTAAQSTFTAPPLTAGAAPVTLTFSLVVNNGLASTPSTMTITVTAPAAAPTANPGASQTVSSGALVTLTGTGTDTNTPVKALTLTWAQPTGATPPVTLTSTSAAGVSPATATFSAPPLNVGDPPLVLTFNFTVDNGATTPTVATTTVTVTAPAQ